MEQKQKKSPVALMLWVTLAWVGFAVVFDKFGAMPVVGYSYGYGYGYGNDVNLEYDGDDVKDKKTYSDRVELCFDDSDKVSYYLLSKNRKFDGASWKGLPGSRCIKLKVNDDFNGKKTKYYLRFKDQNGAISKVFTKTLIYKVKPKTAIRMSRKNFKAGESMVLRGARFSKSDTVAVYFSDKFGNFRAPVKIGTDQFGNLKFSRQVGWIKGSFSWYAVDLKTGRRSKAVNYNVN